MENLGQFIKDLTLTWNKNHLKPSDITLAKYLLLEGILDYFDIVSHKTENEKIHFHLEEKNVLTGRIKIRKSKVKRVYPEIIVEDFPLRGKPVLLHIIPIKRRR